MNKYCPKCGQQNSAESLSCLQCGETLEIPSEAAVEPEVIPNYLVPAIISTLCCCIPFGIPAIVFASQVNSKIAGGDYDGAREASRKAKMWTMVAFGVGIVSNLLTVGLQILAEMGKAGKL